MITKEELKTTVKVLKELAGMKVVHTEMRRGQVLDPIRKAILRGTRQSAPATQ